MKTETITYRALGQASKRLIDPKELMKVDYDMLIKVHYKISSIRQRHFGRMLSLGNCEL